MAIAALVLLAPGLVADTGPEADPAVAGHWLLDPDRSDSFDRATRRALSRVERVLRPRGNVPDTGVRQREDAARAVLDPLDPPRHSVRIGLIPDQVVIQQDEHPERRLHTDGRPAVIDSARRTVGIAEWEAGRLYLEQTSNSGTRVLTTWWVEDGRLHARHEARNTLFGDPIRFTLQFLPAAAPFPGAETP